MLVACFQPSLSPMAPVPCRLSVSASVAGEVGLMSCVLPEDVLGDILSERLQQSDCFQGFVFDGLHTLYSLSEGNALVALLKAFNNRRHIYFINLSQEFSILQEEEKVRKEEEGMLAK
uniref:Hydrocephalus-inducing protein-like n=1 Tax=Callorhinchus milii TaxID=7868 RepID=A0A4W3GWQ9_CALMI|eukprot:gi/632989652/ref/XP_007883764.1/ PREDICTED: hydrocephalus-inducing protein-like [Callorhinchus milii]